jgi:hypothetical protein
LWCYQLAKHYHVDPDVFLSKNIGGVIRHMGWTQRMEEEANAERELNERMQVGGR